MNKKYSLNLNLLILSSILVFLSGCGCAKRPSSTKSADLDDDGWISEDSYYEKTVHYGTTRVDNYANLVAVFGSFISEDEVPYGLYRLNSGNSETLNEIKYGRAKVKIPYVKKVGGTAGMSMTALDHDIGWDNFISELASGDLLVFVHGYNTSFTNAAIRCAQLAHDTNFRGEAVFFSWPSMENPATYAADKERAEENFGLLAEFLTKLRSSNDQKIHIVAHSMGTFILMNSLALLDGRFSSGAQKPFGQIILASPDIAQDDYRQTFDDHDLSNMAERITLYSAENDHVLDYSQIVNYFIEGTIQARLGDSSEQFFVIEGMDTVDTREEISDQFFGHSFYANYRSLVSDMYLLLNYGTDPDDRILQKVVDSKGHQLWFIRD